MAFYKQNMTAFLPLNKNFPRGQFRLADGGLFYCYFHLIHLKSKLIRYGNNGFGYSDFKGIA